MRKSVLAAVAAVSMIGMSSGAVAQSAASLSLRAPQSLAAQGTAGLVTPGSSEIRGGFILPTLAIIVIGVLIYVVAKGGNNTPASP